MSPRVFRQRSHECPRRYVTVVVFLVPLGEDISATTVYYAFVNRITDGLGVPWREVVARQTKRDHTTVPVQTIRRRPICFWEIPEYHTPETALRLVKSGGHWPLGSVSRHGVPKPQI
jgi:hypothetical protein